VHYRCFTGVLPGIGVIALIPAKVNRFFDFVKSTTPNKTTIKEKAVVVCFKTTI